MSQALGETPGSRSFGFKVPEDIIVPVWPRHARYGVRAGNENKGFLDAGLFRELFASPLGPHADRVATLILEFGDDAKGVFSDAGAFLERLVPFLGSLPDGFRYAVATRNPESLRGDYFVALSGRNIAHVFNAWTRMPTIGDQLNIDGSMTADFAVARALLKRGRNYEDAVKGFEPYEKVQEVNEDARPGLVGPALNSRGRRKPAFLFINNRLEGSAPGTIEAVMDGMDKMSDA